MALQGNFENDIFAFGSRSNPDDPVHSIGYFRFRQTTDNPFPGGVTAFSGIFLPSMHT